MQEFLITCIFCLLSIIHYIRICIDAVIAQDVPGSFFNRIGNCKYHVCRRTEEYGSVVGNHAGVGILKCLCYRFGELHSAGGCIFTYDNVAYQIAHGGIL